MDAEGFCRRILMRGRHQKNAKAARRCVGAQYVAALVLGEEGGLAEMPTIGAPMLFARIDDGRVSLVRTGPLERFVAHDDVDGRERELASLARTEEVRIVRRPSQIDPEELDAEHLEEEEVDEDDDGVVYHDAADRTHQLRHLAFDDDQTMMRRPQSRKKGMLPKRS
jgi:hypothetical protein